MRNDIYLVSSTVRRNLLNESTYDAESSCIVRWPQPGNISSFEPGTRLWKYFTVDVTIKLEHKLVSTGIYRIVRHPSYLGSLISFFGLGLVLAKRLTELYGGELIVKSAPQEGTTVVALIPAG